MNFADKVVLITGGTSGIGLATAELFGRQGASVYIGARSTTNVTEQVKRYQQLDFSIDGAEVDVRDSGSVSNFVSSAVTTFGPVDILVNSAGISGGGVTADLSEEVWSNVVDTNLNGTFRLTHAVLNNGGMRSKPWGRIINIASTAGKQGVVLGAPYSASKHGVVGFTKALGNELAPTGITVNAVCPGYVETPMAQQVRRNYAALYDISEEAVLAKFNSKIPMGRYATPDEVAGLVGYLATDSASSITAQALNVCGGLGNF
ncbi:SDR family NAD(P)-dependent oxidoreductase [Rhodococcus sp. H29-C3]|uniref:SDR family NAD(P)-dependent oxidoreductase n=1 Tax=Rhodococcus sp. H29-C3 TaxID=3046307 RepID=UPI0024B8E2CD|nr:SDR family NAD(P)-dependent oxidoreductase [Rhodococcus sp. H29-C3]MDJ0362464.1 SDR family NAD(P)-dependent oxidoreductase [Rhodococcus sp. H29-C3]